MIRKGVKFIVAGILMACGVGLALIGMALLGFDFSKLNQAGEKVTKEHTIDQMIDAIEIDTGMADVTFETSKDDKLKVKCEEFEKLKYNVTVENGVLKIKTDDQRKWYEKFMVFGGFTSHKITIFIPEAEKNSSVKKTADGKMVLDHVKIDVSTGDIRMQDFAISGMLEIDSSTGDTYLENGTAGRMKLDASTGHMTLDKVIVENDLDVDLSTGDFKLTAGDAGSVKIDTSTGDIYCEFLTEKNIEADASTGSVNVPENTGKGGKCKLDASTGDITVKYVK